LQVKPGSPSSAVLFRAELGLGAPSDKAPSASVHPMSSGFGSPVTCLLNSKVALSIL